MGMIRKAVIGDASRIAEITVFNKRLNYRSIFNDDHGSFVDIQVYPTVLGYLEHPETFSGIYVYEDDFVKGMIRIDGEYIAELYVEPFFQNEGIGAKLITFACDTFNCRKLWVLRENTRATAFYNRHGFRANGNSKFQPGTSVILNELERSDV